MSSSAAAEPDLTGRIAVVTGAGSGIGRATALLLAHHGAKVHVADINEQAAQDVAAAIRATGAEALAAALDVDRPRRRRGLRRVPSSRPTTAWTCCTTTPG